MNKSTLMTTAAGVGVATIFGFSFIFTKMALGFLMPIDLIGLRFAVAALVMTLLTALGLIKLNLDKSGFIQLLPLAVLQPVAYFLCETFGIQSTSASEAGMIIGSTPVIVALLAAIFLRERPTPIQFLCILLSTAGVAMMVAGSGKSGHTHFLGMLLLIGAVFSSSLYSILSRRLSTKFTPVEITFVMMWVGALAFNLIALGGHWVHRSFSDYGCLADWSAWVPLLYLGILSSVVAFFLMNDMLSRIEASRGISFINLTTLVSVLAGCFFLGERFLLYQVLGGLLILSGVWGTHHFSKKQGLNPHHKDFIE